MMMKGRRRKEGRKEERRLFLSLSLETDRPRPSRRASQQSWCALRLLLLLFLACAAPAVGGTDHYAGGVCVPSIPG